jgi:hypothetical protein
LTGELADEFHSRVKRWKDGLPIVVLQFVHIVIVQGLRIFVFLVDIICFN